MATNPETIESLTRANIRSRIENLETRDRELTERLALLYRTGKGGSGPAISGREKRIREGAKALLNGAAGLLPDLRDDENDRDLHEQRDQIRLALSVLNQAHLQKAAVEAAEKAVRVTPELKALAKEWLVACLRFDAINSRCEAFLDALPGDVRATLPLGEIPIGEAEIDFNRYSFLRGSATLEDVIAVAIAAGLATHSEIEKARR